ncbi:MAG: O-methyltransferase [Alphaproteobacteria bacterium]
MKKFLPCPVLNMGRKGRDFILLQACPELEFDIANLKKSFQPDWNDVDAAKTWERDAYEIAKIFPADNRAGGINPGDRRALYMLIHTLKPQRVLEVGTHIGASSLHIAMALKSNGGGKLTTVDIINVNDNHAPWRGAGLAQSPKAAMKQSACENFAEFVASPALSYMENTAEKFDFIFLDGDHASSSVYREISAALKLLNPGGVILLHDYYSGGRAMFADGTLIPGPFLGVQRAIRENIDLTVRPLGDLPWPTKQNSCRTTLALLLKND